MFLSRVANLTARTGVRSFSTGREATVGFIGLGQMGERMALNLAKAGVPLVVHDLNPTAVSNLEKAGASSAGSPVEVAEQCSTIITMLPSSPHVQEVYTGAKGVLQAPAKGSLMIDASTIAPQVARDVAQAAIKAGAEMIDAPVSGGVTGAAAGTLTFMVGGSDASVARATPVLNHMGANIIHCGDVGTGQVTKLCNNLALAIQMISISEAMNLGISLGMDASKLASVFNTSTSRCWSTDTYNPVPGVIQGVPSSNDYKGGFGTQLMAKDLGLAVEAAKNGKVALSLGPQVYEIFKSLPADKDFSYVYQDLKAKNGK